MTVTREIHTNKARLVFHNNGIVEKYFLDGDRAAKEMENLRDLNNIFPEDSFKGWTYKTVKLLAYDEDKKKVSMEEARGLSLSSLLKTHPDSSFHMGVWLGLYHKRVGGEDSKLKLYGDFGRTNFLIDMEGREATAIDPGYHFGDVDYPEYDMVFCIYSLVIGALKAKKSPKKLVGYFIDGYDQVVDRPIDHNNILDSWGRIRIRFKVKYKKRPPYLRPFAYLAMHLLNAYMGFLLGKIARDLSK